MKRSDILSLDDLRAFETVARLARRLVEATNANDVPRRIY